LRIDLLQRYALIDRRQLLLRGDQEQLVDVPVSRGGPRDDVQWLEHERDGRKREYVPAESTTIPDHRDHQTLNLRRGRDRVELEVRQTTVAVVGLDKVLEDALRCVLHLPRSVGVRIGGRRAVEGPVETRDRLEIL